MLKEEVDDTFSEKASFSDKMDEWICLIAKNY